MPTDPAEFSYWMALVMPIDENEKARLLPIRSSRLRLKLIVHWVESLRGSWWFSSG
jgi:Lon protease-like protein